MRRSYQLQNAEPSPRIKATEQQRNNTNPRQTSRQEAPQKFKVAITTFHNNPAPPSGNSETTQHSRATRIISREGLEQR
ncbi:hypothetical protein BJ508DRAFT_334268 [Ascobolus immersus RN42]|uniref:Uncharacterized protein n=1 Tax=Ascobolus immersus RN42 TaxID=1160509 RepID=A0A3N4HGS7_ASCIM|nr:hypothetical protein BJ508DRAFT_334268 [Ascobolus immersus RN42]